MATSNQQKNIHLLWRAGFGPAAEELSQISNANPKAYFDALLKSSKKTPAYIDVADNYLKGLVMGVDDVGKQQKKDLTEEEKRKFRQQSQQDIKSLNLTWLGQMVNSNQQLREKLSLFWHGHFACRALNIFFQQQLLDVVRRNALGSFADLLKEVSKSAAMINFLNNNQNRKGHPNENFAREVMELFTLGRGHYTEDDVKEAARAFTGWGAGINGEFVFRKNQHDAGTKTVLGKTGNFTGDEVLDILLAQPQTARFIAKKMYRFFVNDVADDEKVNWLGNRFFQSNYNIQALVTDIFTSTWFYDEKNMGNRIKSPVELMVGVQRILPMEIANEEALLLLQRLLGQLLFYPPNVAGWPGGKTWIDSSTLMMRLRIPQLIYAGDSFAVKPKDDDDQMMGMKEAPLKMKSFSAAAGKQIQAKIDWANYLTYYESIPREKLAASITAILFNDSKGINSNTLKYYTDASGRESFIKTTTIQLMCTPEYQLC
ncbi:MAG: DUF1800 domain-containing protein [Flavihumibacter sp.]|nr:DUF1800 domain-containing protein [Flavihumibacter sp.]